MNANDVKTEMRRLMRLRRHGDAGEPAVRRETLQLMQLGLRGIPSDFASKRFRMAWLDHCAWTLFDEVRQADNEDLLQSALKEFRQSIESLAYDVIRKSDSLYMFWDIVLAGTRDYLVRRVSAQNIQVVQQCLTLLLFSRNKQVRVSAYHGLYHLSLLLPEYDSALDGRAPCGFGPPLRPPR
jgi:hypothetical protein